MRQTVHVEIVRDLQRTNRFMVVIREPCGSETCLADNLPGAEAARMLVPVRKAFLTGVRWFREDVDAYIYTAAPDVICSLQET